MRLPCSAILLLAFALLGARSAHAHPGDLNRCVGADGRSVFTDKPCEELNATVRTDPPKSISGTAPPVRVHVRDCARTVGELRKGMQAALVARDVNRVASFYHWPGTSASGADDILNRFQSMVARPFVEVDLVRARAVRETEGNGEDAVDDAGAIAIVQSRAPDDPTPMRTELGLTRYMGCWWVRF